MPLPLRRLVATLTTLVALLAACGSAAAPPPAAPQAAASAATAAAPAAATPAPKALTQVTLLFDGPYVGFYSPFYVAVAKGYYRAQGLDVKLIPGKGSASTVEQVGHGNYTFGFADAATTAVAISGGVPARVVAVYLQHSGLAVVYDQRHPLTSPQQLIGKTVATSAGSASNQLFSALLAANHIAAGQVKLQNVESSSAKVAALAEGRVQALVGLGNYAVPLAAAKGLHFGQMLFADNGIDMLSNGIVVSDAYLKAHPAIVQAFVRASGQGWKYAVAHPSEAVSIENRALAQAGQKQMTGGLGQWTLSIPLTRQTDTAGHPLGWMAPADWQRTLSTLQRYQGLKHVLPLSDYYTDRFVDAGS